MPGFDPAEHPALTDLAGRLRDLAGDAAYKAGVDYLKKGAVKAGTIAGTTAYATVSGSTEYRVSITFDGNSKVSCSCPVQRRTKFCKHVVALGVALLQRPGEFVIGEAAPEAPKTARPKKGKDSAPKPDVRESQGAGLETVDQLLAALAADGLVGLGTDKLALFATAGELVRARKLRRLGNLILALQRAAGEPKGQELRPADFAGLLVDLYQTRQATGAQLEGRSALEAALAEDLLGKSWREAELEPVTGLELVEVASENADDGEFRIETGYFVDLPTGTIYVEKQIAPKRFSTAPRAKQRCRLLVDEGRLYPGLAPRRLRLGRTRRAPLFPSDIDRLLQSALTSVAALQRRLVARLDVPLVPLEVPVLFRPAGLLLRGDDVGAFDRVGNFVAVSWPVGWTKEIPKLLPLDSQVALFGLLDLEANGIRLRCRSVIGKLTWERGPIFPDNDERRR